MSAETATFAQYNLIFYDRQTENGSFVIPANSLIGYRGCFLNRRLIQCPFQSQKPESTMIGKKINLVTKAGYAKEATGPYI
ncbi:hypothetical protein [Parapedobacter sp. DT-150]|uniref:hypothetical protein n=1 Tax=Parapedobacter sp. DT-150 TaxID=3396162 RepID=UPI003F194953